jgi:hypothetical protein
VALNQDRPSKLFIDLVVKPFRGSAKSTDMIFVRAERSKKDDARHVLSEIYDGSKKSYPRGEMFLFIPITSKLEEEYTATQRDKFIFNHERKIGDEDCTAIYGLKDLNTVIQLSNQSRVSIRTLLKDIPAPPGMSTARCHTNVYSGHLPQNGSPLRRPKFRVPLVIQSYHI